ncbi:MAG: hypothetical protein PHG66_04325 [Candidatus Colwellbacteria bacterium]|nr:hypothetical protein [Candidatus Colwellbacteria bacterium]
MFKCEFCDKELSSKNNLKIHQTRAKYCLKLQKDVNPLIVCKTDECRYCLKSFQYKQEKDKHENICIEKIIIERTSGILSSIENLKLDHEKELATLKLNLKLEHTEELATLRLNLKLEHFEEMSVLKVLHEKEKTEIYASLFNKEHAFTHNQSSKLVDKSGNITNNTIRGKNITMNSLNLSQERLESIKDTYTMKHYERGGIGQADWVIDNIIKDENGNLIYKCTDKNRKNFIYHDDKGNIVTDIHAKKLKESILPIMNTKLKEFKKIKCAELAEISDDESELLEKYSDLYNENRSMGNEFDKRLIEKTYC